MRLCPWLTTGTSLTKDLSTIKGIAIIYFCRNTIIVWTRMNFHPPTCVSTVINNIQMQCNVSLNILHTNIFHNVSTICISTYVCTMCLLSYVSSLCTYIVQPSESIMLLNSASLHTYAHTYTHAYTVVRDRTFSFSYLLIEQMNRGKISDKEFPSFRDWVVDGFHSTASSWWDERKKLPA